MQDAPYPDVPADFGHWLAGFIDGEGCFVIHEHRASFAIRLRADDKAIIDEIAEVTGIGHVAIYGRWYGNPVVAWTVSNIGECARLVVLLDACSLRAKKAHDYAIWRKAVLILAALPPAQPLGQPTPPIRRAAYKRVDRLGREMRATRQYVAQ